MIASTALLLREQGYTGTSFGDVLEHSGAPRGSIYHHFPGGKAELVEDAVEFSGDWTRGLIERAAGDGEPVAALRAFADFWRRTLEQSDFRAGCPVVAVAVEVHDEAPQLTAAAAAVFASWHELLTGMLRRSGVPRARSKRVAHLVVAGIEGAVVLCRAERDTRPLDDVIAELELVMRGAVSPSRAARSRGA